MTHALQLEEFETGLPPMANMQFSQSDFTEEQKLESFENGYQAGWEDASLSHSTDKTRITADLEQNLQALSFTYHEARTRVLSDLQPLIQEIVGKVVPRFAHDNLAGIVAENVTQLARHEHSNEFKISANPVNHPALTELFAAQSHLKIDLIDAPELTDCQVILKIGAQEKQINLDVAATQLNHAVDDFFELSKDAG